MKIAICDDDKNMCINLSNYITKYMNNNDVEFSIYNYHDGDSFLKSFDKSLYDIIFLDIYLTDTTGIEVAKKIRDFDDDVVIIFSTSSLEHTLDGFEVNATHYLVKPLDYKKVFKALDRCKFIVSDSKQYISILSDKNEVKLFIKDIMYIEVYNTLSTIHTKDRSVNTYTSLSKLEELLPKSYFLRTHKSYIINMNFIESITPKGFLLSNKSIVPIKINGRKAIKDIYLDYLFNS